MVENRIARLRMSAASLDADLDLAEDVGDVSGDS